MKSEIYFSLKTPLNIEVRTTVQYWEYLVTFKHPVMKSKEDIVRFVLQMLNWENYTFLDMFCCESFLIQKNGCQKKLLSRWIWTRSGFSISQRV